jgi:hypothetical protein
MLLTPRVIIGIVLMSIFMSCGVWSNMLVTMMIGEINRKRREGDLVSYFWFTFDKTMGIFDEYRRSYPDGKLRLNFWITSAVAMASLVGVAVCIGVVG